MEDQTRNEILAETMYRWYGDDAGWKNYHGGQMPKWIELPEDIKHHWIFVANRLSGNGTDVGTFLHLARKALVEARLRNMDPSDGRRVSLAITKVEEAILWMKSGTVGVG